jgi:peptidoglycan biosynthesis protein MviN/MurJ (putative lipid II flippase)
MSTLVAQHPFLWLAAALLVGGLVAWMLDLFFLRKRREPTATQPRDVIQLQSMLEDWACPLGLRRSGLGREQGAL